MKTKSKKIKSKKNIKVVKSYKKFNKRKGYRAKALTSIGRTLSEWKNPS